MTTKIIFFASDEFGADALLALHSEKKISNISYHLS